MRKLLFPLLSASLLVMLTACGGADEDASADESESSGDNNNVVTEGDGDAEEVTLRMSWWGSQGRHDMTFEIIELYEELNPHVSIEPEFTGFDGYFERMAAQAAGNNLPDIMQQNFGEYLNLYASQGLLADLTELTENGTINVDGVSETVLMSGEKDGKLLGIPTGTNALGVLYNAEMLAEAGIDAPSPDWTWEDFIEIANTVHSELDTYGTKSLEPKNVFEYYLREQGKKLFNEDGTDLGYDDDQLLVDYLTMSKELVDSGVAPGYDVVQEIQSVEDELIVHGRAPFDIRWSNQVNVMSGAADVSFDINLLPGENNTEGMYLKPAMLWSVSENSEHKEEAAKFIDFFTNTVEVFEISGSDRGIPIKDTIREAMSEDLDEVEQKVYDYIELVTENSTPIDSNFPAQAAEVLQALENVDEMVMYGRMTPEEGAEDFRKQATSILGN